MNTGLIPNMVENVEIPIFQVRNWCIEQGFSENERSILALGVLAGLIAGMMNQTAYSVMILTNYIVLVVVLQRLVDLKEATSNLHIDSNGGHTILDPFVDSTLQRRIQFHPIIADNLLGNEYTCSVFWNAGSCCDS